MKRFSFSSLMLVLGLLFIYAPMLILVIYSFNASKLVTVWGGWSVKWYVGLLDNSQLMGSVVRSLEIACYTAIAAVALGTLAAFVLTRITHFKGRTLFGGLVTAPLVMPEVITASVAVAAVRGHGADDWLAPGAWHCHDLDRPHYVLRGLCGGGGLGTLA
ncbi:ABC-type spermidine/putrescine transport system permease subunit II [Pseudomonas sp. R151218B TE3479]